MADVVQASPAPFVWGAGGAQMTPERIAAERKLAEVLMQQGMDYSPIRSPFQGLSRVAQAMMGAYDYRRAGEAETANAAADKDMISRWFSGGAPAAAAAPAVSAAPASPAAPTVIGQGGIAKPDAEGAYGPDAVMLPPGENPAYRNAIASIETGGRKDPYATIGPPNSQGQRPIGRYQVMDYNVGPWTKEHLGREMTPEQFAADPVAQDTVFDKRFGTYAAQYGNPQDAASMWFSGRPLAGNNRADSLGTTVPTYVQKFTKNLGQPAAAPVDPAALPPNATPTEGFAIPGQPSPGAQSVAGAAAPAASPAAPGGPLSGVNPDVLAAMTSRYTSDSTKKIAAMILQHQMGDKVTYQTLPDGTILQMDPQGRLAPKPVYSAPVKPELKDTGTDPITGRKTYEAYDPKTNSWIPVNRPAAAVGSSPPQSGMLAKGISDIDHTLVGPAYLQQFSPEVQAAVKTWMESGTQPTGSPRNNAMAGIIRSIGPKVAQDMGVPMSELEAKWTAHRKMQSDLASSGNSSMGGILANGQSAFTHLANLGDKFSDLGNYSGPDVMGGGHVGTIGNVVGNQILPTPETKGKLTGVTTNALRYGQEATKFYAGSGGGAEERMQALKEHASPSATATQQASFLETEKQLMLGRLKEKVDQIQHIMGADYIAKHPEYSIENNKSLQKEIARIDANIAKLRGGGAAAPAGTAPTGKTSSGVSWSIE